MSLHIQRGSGLGRKLGKAALAVLCYVPIVAGGIGIIGSTVYSGSVCGGPVHDRRRELYGMLNQGTTPAELLSNTERMEELEAAKREHDEIIARPEVQEELTREKLSSDLILKVFLPLTLTGSFPVCLYHNWRKRGKNESG